MERYIYIIAGLCILWTFLPLFVLGAIALVATVSQPIDVFLRRWVKVFLGLGRQNNANIMLQSEQMDCGTAALTNVMRSYCVEGQVNLPQPSSMRDLASTAEIYGLSANGVGNTTFDYVERVLAEGGKGLTLVKASYPFAGWWVRPTALFLDFLIGDRSKGIHWVMLDRTSSKHIYIIDPYFGRITMRRSVFTKCWSRSTLVIKLTKVEITDASPENS
jgi:ABC-type bacteriocin/lantibiotic exporter with double-glycine peptidase domain